jgi:uncharacterized phage protein gp47/JayE
MGSSYVPPAVSSTGLTIPQFAAYLAYLVTNYQAIYGSTVYLGADSADAQDLSIRALQASDLAQALQAVWLSFNPQTAIGTSLDLLGKLIGTARNQATFSTVILTVSGIPGTVITNGEVQDTTGNYWFLPTPITIGSGGSINVTGTAAIAGVTTANPGTIVIISTPTSGWTGVTNAGAANAGEAVEPDSQYRARLLISQAMPSLSLLAGTAADIAAITGVTRSQVYENPFGFTAGYGLVSTSGTSVTLLVGYPFDNSDNSQAIVINGVTYSVGASGVSGPAALTLTTSAGTQASVAYYIGGSQALGPAHSITAIVEGGTSTEIAQTIYNNKNPGCDTNGTTTVSVTDPNNGGISIPISFDVLGYVDIYVSLSVQGRAGFTSATQAAIAANIVAYLNSLAIGETVVYSSLYGAALSAIPNPSQPLFSIESLTSGYAAAATTGTTTNGSPTVTVTSPTGIVNGQVVVGAGIPANTTITISGSTVTLSNNATAGASGVPLTFFNVGTANLNVAYNQASQGFAEFVVVTLV